MRVHQSRLKGAPGFLSVAGQPPSSASLHLCGLYVGVLLCRCQSPPEWSTCVQRNTEQQGRFADAVVVVVMATGFDWASQLHELLHDALSPTLVFVTGQWTDDMFADVVVVPGRGMSADEVLAVVCKRIGLPISCCWALWGVAHDDMVKVSVICWLQLVCRRRSLSSAHISPLGTRTLRNSCRLLPLYMA